jgi:cathepsin L
MTYSKAHPLALENDYKYTARDGACKDSRYTGHVSATGISRVTAKSGSALKSAIEKGPVSVTVEADRSAFQGYRSGVLNSSACGTQLDHAITAVGWGTSGSQDFYIVRNSWGSSWGDRGYIRIASTASGVGICGIQQISVFPSTN